MWTGIRAVLMLVLVAAVYAQLSTKAPFVRPHKAGVMEGRVSAESNNGQNVNMEAQRNQFANLRVANGAQLQSKVDNPDQVSASNSAGGDARGSRQGSNSFQGVANGNRGPNTGTVLTGSQGSDRTAKLQANGRINMDTKMEGQGEKFVAKGDQNTYEADPSSQTRTEGQGQLRVDGKSWNYNIKDNQRGGQEALLEDTQGNILTKKKYRCQAERAGVSKCYDQFGRTVGEVTVSNDREAVVKNSLGIPIAKGKVLKDTDGQPKAVVTDGLFEAKADQYTEKDCMEDFGLQPTNALKIKAPLKFNYPKEKDAQGQDVFTWPSCFDIGATVEFNRAVDPSRLAVEFDTSILPAGRLKCTDPGTCGRECYYCNFCQRSRQKLDLLANTGGNICSQSAKPELDLTSTICPPPKDFEWLQCSGFSKDFRDKYWKKKGDIDARIIVYLRPGNEAELVQEFNRLKGLFGNIWKLEYLKTHADNPSPNENELKEWYVREKKGKEQVIGCRQGILSYTLGGSKANVGFLLEGATITGALATQAPCPQYDRLAAAELQAESQAGAGGATSARPNWFGNLFGGGK